MTYNLQEQIQSSLTGHSTQYLTELLVELTDMNDTDLAMYVANEISKRKLKEDSNE